MKRETFTDSLDITAFHRGFIIIRIIYKNS